MNRYKLKRFFGVFLIAVFLLAGSLSAFAADSEQVDVGRYFQSMLDFAQEMYYRNFTDEEGLKAALRGLFSGLDDYSGFYDREELEALNNILNGNFTGIGAGLEKSGVHIKIIKIYENSPAERAGLLEGDIVTAVDGNSTADKEPEAVASEIRGEAGTKVRLTIGRGGASKEFDVIRGIVTINPVFYRIEGDTAYIRIDSFSSGASEEFNKAIADVNDHGIQNIILDLRGNTGGYVDEAVAVARKLMPPGVVTTLDYKTKQFNDVVYGSSAKNPHYIVGILVDEKTASASEILAGALEDAGNGFLIGQNTYGKGVFQNIFDVLTPEAYKKYSELYGEEYVSGIQLLGSQLVLPQPDEILGAVKITTGYYLTPNGRKIDGIGLKPTVTLPDPAYPNSVNTADIAMFSGAGTIGGGAYGPDVYNAELLLKAAGYFAESADKKYDIATGEAVKKFQTERKLPATGIIDIQTKEKLNVILSELRRENDRQYSKAVEILGWFDR